ncbi:MAG: DUF1015 domain-containing protein [Dehalococcoidia bacterium]
MAELRPFCGLRYNLALVTDLSEVLCPPYDVIGPEEQQRLHQLSPYNMVRLELGQEFPTDTPQENRYTRAAAQFSCWLAEEVLLREEQPALYLLRQRFTHRGQEMARLSLLAAVRLEELDRGGILPHERTAEAPKRDRLALMEACQANLSPVMALYRDPLGTVQGLLKRVQEASPVAQARDGQGGSQLWCISQEEAIGQIGSALAGQPLYLADGHHRYETALAYRDRMRARAQGQWSDDDASNFVLMALVSLDDPGLLVLPYHRLVCGLAPPMLTCLRDRLHQCFHIEPFAAAREGPWLEVLLDTVEELGRERVALGLLGPDGEGPYLLTLKEGQKPSGRGPIADFEAWLLEELVLAPVLRETLVDSVSYVHDPEEAVRRIEDTTCQMAFFLRPLPLELFEAIVRQGQRLPPKSTYFHPKLPTGLVLNPLEDKL